MLALGRALNRSWGPPRPETRQPRKFLDPDRAIQLALFVFVGILLLGSLYRSLPSGDAAENVYQVQVGDLVHRAPFVGYHALGIAFDRCWGLLGFDTITTLGSMSALFGALFAVFTYRLARNLAFEPFESVLAALVASLSGVVWSFGSFADTYIVHTCLALISQVFFLERRFGWSGICFGLAMLSYPSSVALTLPFYAIAAVWKRYRGRELLAFSVPAFVVYVPPVLILFQEYFWGRMGIFEAANNLDGLFSESVDTFQLRIIARGCYYLVSSLHVAIPFILLGAISAARRRHVLGAFVVSLIPIPLWNHFLQASFTDSYLITVYHWLGLLASLGLGRVSRTIGMRTWKAVVLTSFLLLYGTLSFALWVDPLHRRSDEFKRLVESWESQRTGADRILGEWGVALRYNFYTTGTLRQGPCDYQERMDPELIRRALMEPDGIFVIEESPLTTPLKRLAVREDTESSDRPGLLWLQRLDPAVRLTPTDVATDAYRVWHAHISQPVPAAGS